ncbi:MAG: lipopolysaccharide biosynthesis protein [Flavobacteriales bacterium]
MGIVARQGFLSGINLLLGFAIGAFNQMVLIPYVFEEGWPRELFGLLQLIITLSVVFAQFLNFGAISIAVRFMPRYRSENREGELHFYSWFFPFVGMVLLALFLLFFGEAFLSEVVLRESDDQLLSGVIDLGFLVLILFLNSFFMSYFRSLNGLAVANFYNTLGSFFNEVYIRIVQIGGVLLFAAGKLDFRELFVFYTLSYASQFLLMFFMVGGFRLLRIKTPESRSEFHEVSGYGLFAVLDSGAGILVNRIDVIMIGMLVGLSEVVYYQMAFFMATVISIPSRSLGNVSSAVVSESYHRQDWYNIQKLYHSNSLIQTLGGGWIFLLIWVNMESLISLLPPEFSIIRWPFLFLGLSKFFDLITSINGTIISLTPHFRYNFYFNVVLLVLSVIVNLALIPIWGISGAAIATAISICAFNVMKAVFLMRKYALTPFKRSALISVFVLILVGLLGWWIPDVLSPADQEIKSRILPVLVNITVRSLAVSFVLFLLIRQLGLFNELASIAPKIARRIGFKTND